MPGTTGGLLPGIGQLAQLLGVLGGQVAQLGGVLLEVVELPLGVGERRHRLVERDDLPTLAVVAAVAVELDVVLAVDARRAGIGSP